MAAESAETRRVLAAVDRLEGERAVLLVEGVEVPWPRGALPAGVREGHILAVDLRIDREATARQRGRIRDLLDRLTKGGQAPEERG
ncbi:MAG: DUF3006 domain-containing protein [Bacillota bacterium]|nr:DUF3006 domain-containing protein [Bacillota bacterium]